MLAENEFYVEKILDKKVIDNQNYYLIKWYDYKLKDSTWEPESGLTNIKSLIKKFENKIKKINESKKKTYPKSNLIDETLISSYQSFKRTRNDMKIQVISANSFDIPDKIIGINNGSNREIKYLISWKTRIDGDSPEVSFASSDFLREFYPQLLISYLESRISFN